MRNEELVALLRWEIYLELFFSKTIFKQINNHLIEFKSSNRASRYYCAHCKDWICMIYKQSANIWLVCNIFDFIYIPKPDVIFPLIGCN